MTEFGLELHRVWFRGRAEEQRTYCGGLYKTPKHFSCGKYARLRMAKRRLIILNFSRKFSGKTFGGFSKRRIFAASFQKAIIARPLEGRLAQLVQSICLTSRGSGVRIPQRPHRMNAGVCLPSDIGFVFSDCAPLDFWPFSLKSADPGSVSALALRTSVLQKRCFFKFKI